MDYIHIEDLKVRGKHGVMDIERRLEQEFEVSVKIEVDTAPAVKSDNLADALDYAPVKDTIINIIQSENFYLIEKLADTIASELLKDKRIVKVELSIRKTGVWNNGVPGVTIMRTQ